MTSQDHIPVYEIEAALERAWRLLAEAYGLDALTPDAPDLQRPTPRVEFQFQLGQATDHRSTHDEFYRTDAYTGTMAVAVVTLGKPGSADDNQSPAADNGYREHSRFRALVRYQMGRIESDLTHDRTTNGDTLLPRHEVHHVVESGTTATAQGDNGEFYSVLNYDLHVSIRPDAWPSATPESFLDAPRNVQFTGGEGLMNVSWECGTDPALDFLVVITPANPPQSPQEFSVAANIRSAGITVNPPGNYTGTVIARRAEDDTQPGTPADVAFTVSPIT
jgi:hypothetical protein